MDGHFGYGHYGVDDSDAYLITCPDDGTLTISAVYDHGGALVIFRLDQPWSLNAVETFEGGDTIQLEQACVLAGDEFLLFVRSNAGECTGYRLSGEITPPLFGEDSEPNLGLPGAIELSAGEVREGRIGYGYYANDGEDYYRILVQEAGNLRTETVIEAGGRVLLLNEQGSVLMLQDAWESETIIFEIPCVPPGQVYYLVVQELANICNSYTVGYVVEAPDINAEAAITHVVDSMDGAIDLSVSGGTPPYTYIWSNGATTEDLLNIDVGTYTVTITDAAGCSRVFTDLVVDLASSISFNTLRENILIYPNPSQNQVTLALKGSQQNILAIQLFQADGQLVFSQKMAPPFIRKTTIDLSPFTAGLYFIRVVTSTGDFNRKIVLE
jgi:hypothetical protein